MNEYGLFREDESLIPCETETDIFQSLGLHFIPPELRENSGEIEYAKDNPIPDLLTIGDIRGVFHVHSQWSDGVPALRELLEYCREQGYQYLGISDHSQSAVYANGLKPDRLQQQWDALDDLQKEFPEVRIFKGIESDILTDGSLDYTEDILAKFDFVVASVHSNFNLSLTAQTDRILKAVQNPYTTFLGHPTGRLLLARDSFQVDMTAVIKAAGETGTAIEINANPRRLDLDWRLGKLALEHGVKSSINPDAHRLDGFDDIKYGVGIARKGWFTADDVVNAWEIDRVCEFLENKKQQA